MEYAIETFSLTKIFSDWWGRNRVVAVDDLNLKVRTNEVYGFLGPNGSGKTTTLKMLPGLLHPTKGKALILEEGAKSKISVSKIVVWFFVKLIHLRHRNECMPTGLEYAKKFLRRDMWACEMFKDLRRDQRIK